MVFLHPGVHAGSQGRCKRPHLFRLNLRNGIRELVARDVAFSSKEVELSDGFGVRGDDEFQRLNDPEMMIRSLRVIARGCERRRSELKGGVICNVEPPIRDQPCGLAGREVTIRYGE